MFSNTAYEALYEYLGLVLHSKFIDILTSQKIFLAALVMIFGALFFTTTVHFFSRYIPGAWIQRRSTPLSKYFKIIACLFIGISILKVDSTTSVKNFNGDSWHSNSYIQKKLKDIKPVYKVSFAFDLLSRTAEEISALLARMVDKLFATTNSQLEAPNFFFKAIMVAGNATIEDEDLKQRIQFYVNECFDRVIPTLSQMAKEDRLDPFFGPYPVFDDKLRDFEVRVPIGPPTNCLQIKDDVRARLFKYSRSKGDKTTELVRKTMAGGPIDWARWENMNASGLLVNEFYSQQEAALGLQKGAQPPSGSARIFQYLSRFFSKDTLATIFSGGSDGHGAALAAERAQEFSDNLSRAPHVAGAIKMVLIFIFPWLVFIIVAGYWRVLIYWFAIYLSVLLWAPVWTLFYHIMVNISLSADQLEAFGKFSDGISLYSSALITHKMNYLFSVFSWIQLLVGVVLTGGLLMFMRPLLSDAQSDSKGLDFIDGAGQVASTGAKVGGIVGL